MSEIIIPKNFEQITTLDELILSLNFSISKLMADIVRESLVVVLNDYTGDDKEQKIGHASQVLGLERQERLSKLSNISEIMSSFDPATLTAENYTGLKYQLQNIPYYIKPRELVSTSKIESLNIIKNLRDFNFWYKLFKDEFGVNIPIEETRTGFFIQEMAIETAIEKWLKDEFGDQDLQDSGLVSELAKYLYDRLIDPNLDEKNCLSNYLEDYWIWAILGTHNNEIALKLNQQRTDSSNIDTEVLETIYTGKSSESSVKRSIAAGVKLYREDDPSEIHDYYRSTIKIDSLFDRIDHLAILADVEKLNGTLEDKQTLYDNLLKDTRTEILAIYLNNIFEKLQTSGYFNEDQSGAVKSTITGYSDITIKVKDQKGRIYEIQLQTETTLNNKAQETVENDLRKKYLGEIYANNEEFITSFEKDPYDNKNLIQGLVILENGSFENFNQLALEKIKEYLRVENLNDLNEANLTNFIRSIYNVKILYGQSIARSRIIYKVASFLSTKDDFNKLISLLGDKYKDVFRDKITEKDQDYFDRISTNFEAVSEPAVRIFVVVEDKNGDRKLLLGQKIGQRGYGNITTLGGSVESLSNIITGDEPGNWYDLVNKFFINYAILGEFNKVLTSSSPLSFSVVPFTANGEPISYSVLNPTDKIAKLKDTYPQMVVIKVANFDDISLDPNQTENFANVPVWMSFEEFINTMIACSYNGFPYNASLAQTPTTVVLALYQLYNQLTANELNLEFENLPVTTRAEQREKVMETCRTVTYFKDDQGQIQFLVLKNGAIPDEKKYNYLPPTFEEWNELQKGEKLNLVDSAMLDYLNNPENYEKFIKLNGGKISTQKKNLAATFSPKPEDSLEFPGGKKEYDSVNLSSLKEFMEETGLYETQKNLQEAYNKNKPEAKIDEVLKANLTNIALIIKKIEEFYQSYPKDKLQIREGINKDGNPKKTYYFNLDLTKVLGSDLARLFANYIVVNTTMNPMGKPDDNHNNFEKIPLETWKKMQNQQRVTDLLIAENPIVDHSQLDFPLLRTFGLL